MSYLMFSTLVPSALTTMLDPEKARRVPSWDHAGPMACTLGGVTRWRLLPSASTTNSAALSQEAPGSGAISWRSKAMLRPSGDQRGLPSNPSQVRVLVLVL